MEATQWNEMQILLKKAKDSGLMAGTKKMMSYLQEQGLAWVTTIKPELIGCHPLNRSGAGIDLAHLQELIESISEVGFVDMGAEARICIQLDGAPGSTATRCIVLKESDDDFQNTIHTMWYFVFLSPKASFDFNKALCPHCQAIQWEDCRRVTRPIARGKQHSICNHFRIARQYGIQGFECWHDWCHWTHPKCMANRHHQWTGVSWVNVYIISIHPSMSFKRLDDLSLNLSILSEGTTNSNIWQIGETVLSRTWLDMLLCM